MAIADQIAELEAILDAGASEVTVDGQRVRYDLDSIRRRLAELRRQQDATKRPRASQIDLSGF